MPTEIELKLALAPHAATRFRRHPLLAGVKPTTRKLLSIYFDTPDHALSKRGVALRLRRIGYQWVQTLKAEGKGAGALSARPEWEMRVTGNRPDLVMLPTEARALLDGIDAADLRPCFSTEFTRAVWHLEKDGSVLELALDRGEARAGEAVEPILEVECELKQGEPAWLYEVATSLLASLPLTLEPRSKARRGYVLAGVAREAPLRATNGPLRAGDDARAAWEAMRDSALSQLVGNVPGALLGEDIEYLHQIRVAARRLRATLGLGRDLGLAEPLWAADLRWLMGELSPARDWDVFATETLPGVSAGLGVRADMEGMADAVAERRAAAHARARAALTSPRFVAWVLSAEQPMAWPEGAPAMNVAKWARRVLDRRLKKAIKLGGDFSRLDTVGRHALRIAAKRLRYSAEAFAALDARAARAYLNLVGGLQDALGMANDLAVAHTLLEGFESSGLAHAAGLVEGYMVREAASNEADLARRCKRFMASRPFWRRGRIAGRK